MKKEEFNKELKIFLESNQGTEFSEYIINKTIEIEKMDLNEEKKEELYSLVIETIERQLSLEGLNLKENIDAFFELMRSNIQKLEKIRDATNNMKKDLLYLKTLRDKTTKSINLGAVQKN